MDANEREYFGTRQVDFVVVAGIADPGKETRLLFHPADNANLECAGLPALSTPFV